MKHLKRENSIQIPRLYVKKHWACNLKQCTMQKQHSEFSSITGTSLVAQWLRIRLPMQGTWVRALVQEDPTCCGATKPVRHNY